MAGRQLEATAKALNAWRRSNGRGNKARIALDHGIAQSTLYRAIKADCVADREGNPMKAPADQSERSTALLRGYVERKKREAQGKPPPRAAEQPLGPIKKAKAKVPSVAYRTTYPLEAMTEETLLKWRGASMKHGVRIFLQNGVTFHPSGLVTDDRPTPSKILMRPDYELPQTVESEKPQNGRA
ncbi:MAG: hypothetical protein IT530_14140 [Burkholderiales bacterium]|nr:hypothetical protein [Burkholderiales bacterium]